MELAVVFLKLSRVSAFSLYSDIVHTKVVNEDTECGNNTLYVFDILNSCIERNYTNLVGGVTCFCIVTCISQHVKLDICRPLCSECDVVCSVGRNCGNLITVFVKPTKEGKSVCCGSIRDFLAKAPVEGIGIGFSRISFVFSVFIVQVCHAVDNGALCKVADVKSNGIHSRDKGCGEKLSLLAAEIAVTCRAVVCDVEGPFILVVRNFLTEHGKTVYSYRVIVSRTCVRLHHPYGFATVCNVTFKC